jgi:putative NIF3 family GTP cyclohydrolase 1 type 2
MATIASVLSGLSAVAPGDKAAGWDAHGLQIGDPSTEVIGVGVCHEVTGRVADRAVDLNLNLLVSYHPLIFNATNKFVAGSGPVGRAYQLARAGAALAIFHTAWDAAPGGTADSLASALGLREVGRFGPVEASAVTKLVTFVPVAVADAVAQALVDAGAGQIGNYTGCTFRSEGLGTFIPGPGAEPVVGHEPGRGGSNRSAHHQGDGEPGYRCALQSPPIRRATLRSL